MLASTTSHKREPLLATLEVLARLGLRDLDLNLHHIFEEGVAVDAVNDAVATNDLRVWMVSGGWCDFFHGLPLSDVTDRSVVRQVDITQRLGATGLRLFFGRLNRNAYSTTERDTICLNLRRLSDRHPDMCFDFENHEGASLDPEVCAEILTRVGRPNIRMTFDPINFEHAGVNALAALDIVHAFVGHVHLKGLDHGQFCEFGVGDVDLLPVLGALESYGYRGGFSVEYEGPGDGTLHLYQSVRRAQAAVAAAR